MLCYQRLGIDLYHFSIIIFQFKQTEAWSELWNDMSVCVSEGAGGSGWMWLVSKKKKEGF